MKKPPRRCDWPGAADDLMIAYHDREWGTPSADDATHLSFWFGKRASRAFVGDDFAQARNYRRAFAGFDAARVARFSARKIETLMADAGIVRNRKKIEAAVNNARVFLEVAGEFGSFARYIWGFVDDRPRQTGILTRGRFARNFARIRRAGRRHETARLSLRRQHCAVFAYAGDGSIQRSRARLLPPKRMRRARQGLSRRRRVILASVVAGV